MLNAILLSTSALLLMGLLLAEKKGKPVWILVFKTPLSVLFVVAAVLQPHPCLFYYYLVLLGLACGVVGDVCLAVPRDGTFKAGLAVFLAGHLFYAAAFVGLTRPWDWVNGGNILILVAAGCVWWWLLPYVGRMLVPVTAYIVVISIMLAAAWAAFLDPYIPRAGAWTLLLGALCFYLSDVFVAGHRFIARRYLYRLLGLPLYYAGQFLLAFSVGLIM